MMTKEEIYSVWAPDGSPWSVWAKPVLFAHLLRLSPSEVPLEQPPLELNWVPPSDGRTALVLDLPGPAGVALGLALAVRGFRPVPLYNAIPMPGVDDEGAPLTEPANCAADVLPIISALRVGTPQLADARLPLNAPPAFLLDANRRGLGRTLRPGDFDNRSVSFTTDFPSANFLASRGIDTILVVLRNFDDLQSDLAHTLRRWQDAGLKIQRKSLDSLQPPETFEVPKPPWYALMFQRVLAGIGFRRSSSGGFGGWIADSPAVG